jgi:hypothetical protein
MKISRSEYAYSLLRDYAKRIRLFLIALLNFVANFVASFVDSKTLCALCLYEKKLLDRLFPLCGRRAWM